MFRIITAALEGARDVSELIIIFHDRMASACVRHHPPGCGHLLPVLVGRCAEGEYPAVLIVLRDSIQNRGLSMLVQLCMVQGQPCLTVLVDHITVFRIILTYFNGSKIILHLKALYIPGFLYINID